MAEFEIDGHTYRTSKMNGRQQFHLLRKLGPMAGLFSRFVSMEMPANEATRNWAVIMAFWQEFSNLTQAQADDLLNDCLMHTRRLVVGGNGSGQVIAQPMFAGRDMFEDTEIMTLMRICWEVVSENLGGFFPTGSVPDMSTPQPSPPPPEPEVTSPFQMGRVI